MTIGGRAGVGAAVLLLGLVGSAARAETFWSAHEGALVAFELDFETGGAEFTMQSSGGGPFEEVYYYGVAREPATGVLWVMYYDNVLGRSALGRLRPGSPRPQEAVFLPETLGLGEPHPKFSPAGVLYFQAYEFSTMNFLLATIDLVTGNVTPVLTFSQPNALKGLAFHPVTGLLYFSGWENAHDGYIDTLTTPQHVRQRVLSGDFQPGELLFGATGEMLLMNTFFYRIVDGTLVTVSFPLPVESPIGKFYATLNEGSPAEGTEGCLPSRTRDCLQLRRFAVEATYDAREFGGTVGTAAPQLESDESLKFSFFTPENLELFVKLIDGCGYNGHYWIFASGLTNLGVSLRVTDTATGAVYTHENPAHQTFIPLLDIEAFACVP